MSNHQHDDESFAIGWISISDLLMLGTLSLFLVSRSLENRSASQTREISDLTIGVEQKEQALADANARWLQEKTHRDELRTTLEEEKGKLTDLQNVKLNLAARLEEKACQLEESAVTNTILQKTLAETEARVTATQLELYVAKFKAGALGVSLEIEKKNAEETASKLASVSEELEIAKRLNGTLKIDKDSLLSQLSTTEIKERGFRQELLGIRARNDNLNRVIFVVDCSASMDDAVTGEGGVNRWSYVRGIIEKWLILLPCNEVQVITFSDTVPDVFPRENEFVSMVGDAKQRSAASDSLVGFLASKLPSGGTDTQSALRKAYESENVDAMFLFTDGQPMNKSPSEMTSADFKKLQDDVLALVKDHSLGDDGVPINVIGLGDYFSQTASGADQVHLPFGKFLVRIAEESGGVFLGR